MRGSRIQRPEFAHQSVDDAARRPPGNSVISVADHNVESSAASARHGWNARAILCVLPTTMLPRTGTTKSWRSRRAAAGGQQLVLRGRGTDGNRPIDLRYTVRIDSAMYTRLKEFRTAGAAWEYRHEYRFARPGT